MPHFDAASLSLLLALALDVSLGDPPNRYHPVAWMGTIIHSWDKMTPISGAARRFFSGLALVLAGALLFALPLWALYALLSASLGLKIVFTAILLKPMFSLRRLLEAGKAIEDALLRGDLAEGQRLTSFHLVSRATSELDERHVASAVVESLAENLCDSIAAPLLAFILGGLPAAWAYRFVNTADAMIGYHGGQYEYFGKSAAVFDDVLNYVPARLAGMTLCFGALLCGEDWQGAWRVMRRDHAETASPNAGWPMSAAAGALNLSLEKPGNYVLNRGFALPRPQDIRRARRLVLVSALLWAAGCMALLVIL